jgi:hypothetical protein
LFKKHTYFNKSLKIIVANNILRAKFFKTDISIKNITMKIRIKGNSLRYRLTKTDVEQFTLNGYIEETINFGSQTLTYALERSKNSGLMAIFDHNKITLLMPIPMATEWNSTERVGFEGIDKELFLLVEKDFKCLDNVAEDQSDNYPNPLLKT